MHQDATGRTITAHEPRETPWLSVVFGYGPMLPLAAGAAAAWWTRGRLDYPISLATTLYGSSILLFLAGVRRGLSFRTEGGATPTQIGTMLGLYGLGLVALLSAVMFGKSVLALSLLLAGYLAIAVLDPIAARTGEAPLYFARLRPLQMPIAILSLAALLALKMISPY